MESVIILGKGKSLERLEKFNHGSIDTVILINEFWETPDIKEPYYKNKIVHNCIKDKKIILILTPCCDVSKIGEFINKYNVISAFYTTFDSGNYRFRKNTHKFIKNLPIQIQEPMEKECFGCLGSLSVGIIYAQIVLNINKIYIFGLDFYEKDYFIENYYNYKKEISQIQDRKRDWIVFIERHSTLELNIYSFADFKYSIKKI